MTLRKPVTGALGSVAAPLLILLALPLSLATGCANRDEAGGEAVLSDDAAAEPSTPAEVVSSAGYDPAADPVADLAAAVAEAGASGRRILLEVGGEWCSWCHILEEFVHSTPAVEAALDANYVVVKVNFSDENENTEFLAGYPEIQGYPHIFVLERDGFFLHSQDTAELEAGEGYDTELVLAFLDRWAPLPPDLES